jgi:hypothetical protein
VILEVIERQGRLGLKILDQAPLRDAQLVFGAQVCAAEADVDHAAQGHPMDAKSGGGGFL